MSKSNGMKIGFSQFMEKYPDEDSAKKQLEEWRWGGQVRCPHCDSVRVSETQQKMPYRCRDCRKRFSVRVGSVMEASSIPLRTWLAAIYIASTDLEGTTSTKPGFEFDTTYMMAWNLSHHLRKVWETDSEKLPSMVEVD